MEYTVNSHVARMLVMFLSDRVSCLQLQPLQTCQDSFLRIKISLTKQERKIYISIFLDSSISLALPDNFMPLENPANNTIQGLKY